MKSTLLLVLVSLSAVYTEPLDQLYNSPKESLTLLFMGDTQHYFKCEPGNTPCKKVSRKCRESFGLNYYLRPVHHTNHSAKSGEIECAKVENRYANRVQRQAIGKLIQKMRYPPAALILNGDLTDFGWQSQLDEFKRIWIRNFPIPILPGLGNHDYENNVDDCGFNFCAHTMLSWYINYAKNHSLEVDYKRNVKGVFDITYRGSMGYSTRVCSLTGANCANVIQLNNAVDYEKKISSFLVDWEVESAIDYLKTQLNLIKDMDMPILINMHQCENTRLEKLKELLGNWIYETRNYAHKKRIAVFFAHLHSNHNVRTFCFHDTPVPFVYVGSVPNNRFTFLTIKDNTTSLHGLATRDAFEYGHNLEILGTIDNLWSPCTKSNQSYVPFRDDLADLLWD